MRTTLKERLRAFGLASSAKRISRQAAALSAAERADLLQRVGAKTLIFTVTSGRSGTQTLARIFGAIPEVEAAHEGVPAFQEVMRLSLSDPSLARDFLLTRKLPAIAASPKPVYLESSHVFGKGFLLPALRLGLRPRVLFLKRDPRKVALSLERIGATPHRTAGGRAHHLSPADPSLLPVQPWDDFTDYQLCYWYALEAIRRQRIKHDLAVRAGCNCHYLSIEELRAPADVWTLLMSMGVDVDRSTETEAALNGVVGRAFNLKEKKPVLRRPEAELEGQERMVVERVQACLPELNVRQMVAFYLGERTVGETSQIEAAKPAARTRHPEPIRVSA
jgi:hypothetical protein